MRGEYCISVNSQSMTIIYDMSDVTISGYVLIWMASFPIRHSVGRFLIDDQAGMYCAAGSLSHLCLIPSNVDNTFNIDFITPYHKTQRDMDEIMTYS